MAGSTPESEAQLRSSGVAYRMARAMLVVLFFWVFWKFGGYIITAMVVRKFGSGPESDAFFFAMKTIMLVIYAPALAVVVPAFVPVFIDERNAGGEARAGDFARTVLAIVLMGCGLVLAAMFLWAEPITSTLVRGFDAGTRGTGVGLLNWMVPGAALMVVFLVLRAILNSYKVFSYPSAAEAGQKFVWIVVIVFTMDRFRIASAAHGLFIGSLAMVAVAVFGLRRHLSMLRPGLGAMSRSRWGGEVLVAGTVLVGMVAALRSTEALLPANLAEFRDVALMSVALAAVLVYCAVLWRRAEGRAGAMARFARLAVPLGLSAFFATYREVVTGLFQSFASTGVYSDIEGAKKISNFPTELIALALSVAMLPYLCELASRKDRALLGDIVTKAIRMLAVGFVPLTVLTLVMAEPVVRLALDRGDRAIVHLHYTAVALQITAAALVVYAAERVLMQAYFSLQRMWAPALLGIAATLLQVGALMIAVHWLRWDYPVQIFFLVAAAYPVSRAVKNLAMLLVLKRHVNVLPARATLIFAARLAALSAAVGAAAWFARQWTERQFPYERYRLQKAVVDSFEVLPETWYSVDADTVMISAAPDAGHGNAVKMVYGRHGGRIVRLERDMSYVDCAAARSLSASLWGVEDARRLGVSVRRRGERAFEDVGLSAGAASPSGWTPVRVDLDGEDMAAVAFYEKAGGGTEPGKLFVDDVALLRADGAVLFTEDFDGNGWEPPAGTDTRPGAARVEGERYALVLPSGLARATKDVRGYGLSGTDVFRCRVRAADGGEATVAVELGSPSRKTVRDLTVDAGQWTEFSVTREELDLSREEWAGLTYVAVSAPEGHGGLWLDDVTFRRPARSRQYAALMLVHCALPALAGLAIMLPGLVLMRFAEFTYVLQWVKDRGWKRRHEVREAADGGE